MKLSNVLLFLLVLPLVGGVARAEVYKCRDADGKLAFRDQPCPKGSETQTVKLHESSISGSQQPGTTLPIGNGSEPAPASTDACADIARPLWDLQPIEAGGQLSPGQAEIISRVRNQLRQTCAMRLASSALAFACVSKGQAVTRAVAKAVDPKYAADLDREQSEYETQCNDVMVLRDVMEHLRKVED